MRARAALLAVLLAAVPQLTQAQVYTWRDPQSGATRISNVAPAWYRHYAEVAPGPRVVVTLGRTVIDDTGLPLEKRIELARRQGSPR
jgi:hypothetical protein